MKKLCRITIVLMTLASTSGCPRASGDGHEQGFDSDQLAAADIEFSDSDVALLAKQNNAFAVDLLRKLAKSKGNVFFSPFSISQALAMTYAGARGNTREQMARVLRFTLAGKKLHSGFAGLNSRLRDVQKDGKNKLLVADSVWPQKAFPIKKSYFSLLRKYYGVSIEPLDFKDVEGARGIINRWVDNRTGHKIVDLLKPGVLDQLSRLVLVDAVWFKGTWKRPFPKYDTMPRPFHLSPSEKVDVVKMKQKAHFKCVRTKDLEVLQLPYIGNKLSMLVIVPLEIDGIDKVLDEMSVENLEGWLKKMKSRDVTVFMPKFKMSSTFRLDESLESMGMLDAFSDSKADFSAMSGEPGNLYLSAVVHQAFVELDETGTKAAASTASHMRLKSFGTGPVFFDVDRPFVFLIRENSSGSILFMGRVLDPR